MLILGVDEFGVTHELVVGILGLAGKLSPFVLMQNEQYLECVCILPRGKVVLQHIATLLFLESHPLRDREVEAVDEFKQIVLEFIVKHALEPIRYAIERGDHV